jgi:hypothetical protein
VRAAAVLAAAAWLLAGCSSLGDAGAIKAYEGPERRAEEGLLNTQLRQDVFSVSDGAVVTVDGVALAKPAYGVRLLAGDHWIGVMSSVRHAGQKREQFCAFELNVDAGCAYLPTFPTYPGAGIEAAAGQAWQVVTSMQVAIECRETSYATRVAVECSNRTLCRGEAGCPKPDMRCTQEPRFSFGACAAP